MSEKKRFWVAPEPFSSELVTAAVEAGADAVAVPAGQTEAVHALGRVQTLADDGDLQWGRDVQRLRIANRADEERLDPRRFTVIENADWTIIPLENLIARAPGRLIQTVRHAQEAEIALQVMERGADGVLLVTDDAGAIRRTAAVVEQANAETVALTPVRIVEVRPVTLSDRCCIDTACLLPPGEGLLVGNAAGAQFLVHNENVPSPYADARPFRVNAGAVHAYLRLPRDRTAYLCELKAGDEVLAVDPEGRCRVAAVGRNKIERRPMLLVRAEAEDGRAVALVLQNAETVRLTTPAGEPASVTRLQTGDTVLAAFGAAKGRHFGQAIDESIQEH